MPSTKLDVTSGAEGCSVHGFEDYRLVESGKYSGRKCFVCKRARERERWQTLSKNQRTNKRRRLVVARVDSKYYVEFSCNHDNIFVEPRPEVGEILLCRHCGNYKPVVNVCRASRGKKVSEVVDAKR